MFKIRLLLVGIKHNRQYYIVAIDSKYSNKSCNYKYKLGYVDIKAKKFVINKKLYSTLISSGAMPSKTVKKLFLKYN